MGPVVWNRMDPPLTGVEAGRGPAPAGLSVVGRAAVASPCGRLDARFTEVTLGCTAHSETGTCGGDHLR